MHLRGFWNDGSSKREVEILVAKTYEGFSGYVAEVRWRFKGDTNMPFIWTSKPCQCLDDAEIELVDKCNDLTEQY